MKETSNFGLMIRFDNREIRVFESKFDRAIGDILTIDNMKFKVCALEPSKQHAGIFLSIYGREWCFKFFNYNK